MRSADLDNNPWLLRASTLCPLLFFVMPCLIGCLSDGAPWSNSAKCSSAGVYGLRRRLQHDRSKYGITTTCKSKETFTFAGVGNRSRRPENNARWLAPTKIFQEKGGAVILGLCA